MKLFMDGFDDCIAGIVERFGQPSIVCYDKDKVLDQLMEDGMTEEEAMEYFEYNQIGAWMGENTPCFISPFDEEQMDWEQRSHTTPVSGLRLGIEVLLCLPCVVLNGQ